MWKIMELFEVINKIKKNHHNSYLEIGVREGATFEKVEIKDKYSVDIKYRPTYKMKSDIFFDRLERGEIKGLSSSQKWDIILIDGDHEANQFMRDCENALNHLSRDGYVLAHDVLPWNKKQLKKPGSYTGDVYKGFIAICLYRSDIEYFTLAEANTGVGVIKFGKSNIAEKIDWDTYMNCREKLLNIRK